MTWSPHEDFAGRELDKIWHLLPHYTRGRVLDIGAGASRQFAHWVTLDAGKDYGGQRVADVQATAEEPLPFADGVFDAVVSSHCLEHIVDHKAALADWWRLVKVGGHLVLYLPHRDLYPRCGEPGANPDHKHDFAPSDILDAMRDIAPTGGGWVCLEDETRSQGSEYSFFQVFRKRPDEEAVYAPYRRPEKAALVVRLGAFGDQIVAASVLPGLKDQGYAITYMSANPGAQAVKHDPHIDSFLLVDKDQIPNERLGEYWARLEAERFDRVVNLSESIEGELLTLPGRPKDALPDEARRKLCDVNYLERTHDIAGVPYEFAARFYPTPEEVAGCQRQIIDAYPGPIALWVLNGSSPHKVWPYMAQAIVRLLYRRPDLTIVLAGDEGAQKIEDIIQDAAIQFFGSAKRVVRTAGGWPIRATMTLAGMVDAVVGPETGVMNAVCMEDVPKVVFLSHSSANALTKHWRNTTSLLPEGPHRPACYPCFRLHYGWDRCHKHQETGAAICQAAILPEQAVDAIIKALETSPRQIDLPVAAE